MSVNCRPCTSAPRRLPFPKICRRTVRSSRRRGGEQSAGRNGNRRSSTRSRGTPSAQDAGGVRRGRSPRTRTPHRRPPGPMRRRRKTSIGVTSGRLPRRRSRPSRRRRRLARAADRRLRPRVDARAPGRTRCAIPLGEASTRCALASPPAIAARPRKRETPTGRRSVTPRPAVPPAIHQAEGRAPRGNAHRGRRGHR